MIKKIKKAVVAVTGLTACFASSQAFAEGFSLYEYSSRGVALGGATMAGKADPSAMASNPALITKLKGRQVQVGFSTIMPLGEISFDPKYGFYNNVEVEKKTWVAPHAYYTHQINDEWYIGVGQFSRFGVGFEYADNWPGRFNSYMAGLVTGSINTNIAWKANDKLSLSAGVEAMYVTLDISRKLPIPVPGLNAMSMSPFGTTPQIDAKVKGAEDIAFGFNAAMHYQINEQWGVGLLYRSSVRVNAEGKNHLSVENVPAMYLPLLGMYNGRSYTAKGTVTLPESISGGVAWSPRPDLTIEVGGAWTRWSRFNELAIVTEMGSSNSTTVSPKDWKNVWRLNVGVEYEALDWLTLRAGYIYDQSPMTEHYADYLVPSDDRDIYSLGAGFKWNQWTADIAYSYVDIHDRKYQEDRQYGVLASSTNDMSTHVFSTSLGYKF